MFRVMIVEDEQLFRESLARRVEKDGHFRVAAAATNGLEALLDVPRVKPDVILSDIRMPGMDGLAFLEQLRRDAEQTIVVFISGFPEFENVRTALRLGAFDYLTKPLEDAELHRVLARIREQLQEQEKLAADRTGDQADPVSWIAHTKKWLQANVRQASLQEAADHAKMNTAAFSRKFSTHAGVTFMAYITELRLERARELLADPNRKIAEIAQEIGFYDQKYFSELFKKHLGCTPQEYRRGKP
ncbi:MAG: response regulator [Paenibacillaceae bacterium]|nr:response regulator [Paenibacillaceae bacterium]